MVYLLRNKNEAAEKLKDFVQKVEAKWNLKIAKIRCDNGREYINNTVIQWCKNKGIEIDTTIPHTPQLNGRAERLNRALMEKVRALLFDAEVKKELWGEALYTATYILNRSPTNSLKKTPYEMWEERKLNLLNLQIFGCEAFAKVLGSLKKLDSRSENYKFIGYAPSGYRLWDSKKRKIIIARDVKFKINEKTICKEEVKYKRKINLIKEDNDDSEEENKNSDYDENEDVFQEAENEENLQKELENVEDNQEDEEENYSKAERIINTRKISRRRKLPEKFKDYVYLTYTEAITGVDSNKWIEAINEEKKSLKENDVWEIVDENHILKGKLLHSKWIFRIKQDGKYKARLVIKGCEQKKEIDYQETYSPVIGHSALRSIFALATAKDYKMVIFDVKTAFLYGDLEDEIYMYQPEGYNYKNKILKLKKAIYGLKQAPLRWNIRFTNFLFKKGFVSLNSEQCLFKKKNNEIILAIYVDDGLLVGSDIEEINKILIELASEFKIKVSRNTKMFVGHEIKTEEDCLILSQEEYIKKILIQSGMENAKPVKIPLQQGENTKTIPKTKCYPYREMVGSLLYASTKTRPDIAFAVNYVSRSVEEPTEEKIKDVKHILKYLNSNLNRGIQYKKNKNINLLQAYSDADFAGDIETRRSTTGYIIFLAGGPISWCSRKQPIIAQSTTEAEYVAAAECCKELIYLKTLLEELICEEVHIELNIDNQSAISLIKNGIINKRSKHIDVKFRFIHELVKDRIIRLKYCPTSEQIADILTKPLAATNFIKFRDKIVKEQN